MVAPGQSISPQSSLGETHDECTLREAISLSPCPGGDGAIDYAAEPRCRPASLTSRQRGRESWRARNGFAWPAQPRASDQIRGLAKVLLQDARYQHGVSHHDQRHLG